MIRLILILAAICFIIIATPLFSVAQTDNSGARPDSESVRPANEASTLSPPSFQLEPKPDDTPLMARKKAALRLFSAYNVTVARLEACKAQNSEAVTASKNFNSRNGNTLAILMRTIKTTGGINADIKASLEDDLAQQLAGDIVECPVLIKAVNRGEKDLYKASEYASDYNLIK